MQLPGKRQRESSKSSCLDAVRTDVEVLTGRNRQRLSLDLRSSSSDSRSWWHTWSRAVAAGVSTLRLVSTLELPLTHILFRARGGEHGRISRGLNVKARKDCTFNWEGLSSFHGVGMQPVEKLPF